jgi:hypothetical protein
LHRMISEPISRNSSGDMAFTVPWVPTGMNAGVCIVPREVTNRPVRADPSLFLSSICIAFIIADSPAGKSEDHKRLII